MADAAEKADSVIMPRDPFGLFEEQARSCLETPSPWKGEGWGEGGTRTNRPSPDLSPQGERGLETKRSGLNAAQRSSSLLQFYAVVVCTRSIHNPAADRSRASGAVFTWRATELLAWSDAASFGDG